MGSKLFKSKYQKVSNEEILSHLNVISTQHQWYHRHIIQELEKVNEKKRVSRPRSTYILSKPPPSKFI